MDREGKITLVTRGKMWGTGGATDDHSPGKYSLEFSAERRSAWADEDVRPYVSCGNAAGHC